VLFVLVISMLALVVVGCGKPAAPAPTTGQPAAPKVEVIRWSMATSWPQGWLLHQMAEHWAEEVKQASGGRLLIDVSPSGAIVPPLEVLDATHTGSIDAFHSWPGYWMGKMPPVPFFASIPMGFEPLMHLVWMYEEGGIEYFQKMYDNAGMNVIVFPGGITHPELLAHSNVPLAKLEDWKGLKYRTPGWWGEILKGMGVAVVTLPAAELYPSLEKKLLDALEFSSPAVNNVGAFHEVTQYYTGPGMHQPSVLFEITINKDSYNALPDDLKAIVKTAARSTTMWGWAKDISLGIQVLDQWEKRGNTAVVVEEAAQHEFRKQAWAYIDGLAAKDPFFKEIWESQKAFYDKFVEYEDFMVPVRKK
jgi:TRAP-type mannitol/chloroaromatic compound transport system substrate-binding protein